MTPTCPCCGSAEVRLHLPRWDGDEKTHNCRRCHCEWNEARRSQPEGCREAFEKWCLTQPDQFLNKEQHGTFTHYVYAHTESAWIGWQAAWNARRSPDARGEEIGPVCDGPQCGPKYQRKVCLQWVCERCGNRRSA